MTIELELNPKVCQIVIFVDYNASNVGRNDVSSRLWYNGHVNARIYGDMILYVIS